MLGKECARPSLLLHNSLSSDPPRRTPSYPLGYSTFEVTRFVRAFIAGLPSRKQGTSSSLTFFSSLTSPLQYNIVKSVTFTAAFRVQNCLQSFQPNACVRTVPDLELFLVPMAIVNQARHLERGPKELERVVGVLPHARYALVPPSIPDFTDTAQMTSHTLIPLPVDKTLASCHKLTISLTSFCDIGCTQ
jgi:hypothetical protein